MSFFPRSFVTHDSTPSSFHPLFRLLDDFDNYSRANPNINTSTNSTSNHRSSAMRSFTPRFDVKEVGDIYELHGELPGIAQKDIEIEFTDDATLTIKGRTERTYTSGTPPGARVLEENPAPPKAIESASEAHKTHQPTIEDEEESSSSHANTSKEIATTSNNNNNQIEQQESKEPQAKYWVSERSVGEFARSFSFPVRVDQENVTASMKDGILSVVVPKAKKTEARRIVIN